MRRHAPVVPAWLLIVLALPAAGADENAKGEASEEITVVGRLPQVPLAPSSVPAGVVVIDKSHLRNDGPGGLPESLAAAVPGLSMADEQGNAYQPDLSLRGFEATSVTGVPQGVSVFLDGVRVNEPTAEEINFDLLPTEDLERIEVVPGPSVIFGRNTLAGTINLTTRRGKDGAAFAELSGGSAGFRKYRGGVSGRAGAFDLYLSGTGIQDDGWRAASGARLGKVFAKLGLRAADNDLTLSYQHVDNRISQAGSLPAAELARDRTANYSAGDFFAPVLNQLALNFRRDAGSGFVVSANGFGRLLEVEQFNVNLAADNSRLFSRTGSLGGTVQVERNQPLFGAWDQLIAGLEYAHSNLRVSVFDENRDRTVEELDTRVRDGQDTFGAYLQDTFQIARGALREGDELILTLAGRWDFIRHGVADESPARPERPSAGGVVAFRRLDPMVGANYNLSRDYGVYLSWSQGFRTPALLELTCAGPAAICPGLQAGSAPDPPLHPVRATNYEVGLRARPLAAVSAQISAYRTDVFDDIFSVSPTGTTGVYFQNIGRTRRQGLEVSVRGKPAPWLQASVSYALTDARFEDDVVLATARPVPGCAGPPCSEQVRSGSEFPLVPRHRGRANLDLHPLSWLSLSLSGAVVGSQRLRGDEENVAARLDPWFSLDAEVRVSAGRLAAWVRGANLLDARHTTFGTFAANPKLPGAPVEPFYTPGRPFQLFAGVSYGLGAQ